MWNVPGCHQEAGLGLGRRTLKQYGLTALGAVPVAQDEESLAEIALDAFISFGF